MSLVQYGVTDDSRVILSVKDADSNAASSTASTAAIAAGCSKQPELSSELMMLLQRHFTPADAERVAEEFKQVNISCITLNSSWCHTWFLFDWPVFSELFHIRLFQVRFCQVNFWELLWQNFYRPDALPVAQPTASML